MGVISLERDQPKNEDVMFKSPIISITVAVLLACITAQGLAAEAPNSPLKKGTGTSRPLLSRRFSLLGSEPVPFFNGLLGGRGIKHCGLYVHGCWLYNYPFATHSWNRGDYDRMFRLLQILGYDRVMLWPMLEGIPMPMSAEDAAAVAVSPHH